MRRTLSENHLRRIIREEKARTVRRSPRLSSLLFEQDDAAKGDKPAETSSGGGKVDINAGPAEVLKAAADLIKDPKMKAALSAGATDGDPNDEIITITPGKRMASALVPTQKNIDVDKSLADQIYDKFGNLDAAISGGRIASKEGKFPILTFGNYILDGHHRWSQACITNPKCQLDTAEISAPGVDSPKAALGLVHTILFALYGQSKTKDVAGTNLVGLPPETMKKMVTTGEGLKEGKPIVQSAIDKLYKAGLIKEATAEAAGDMYAQNVPVIKEGDFPRAVMPQPLDSGSPDGLTSATEEMTSGKINFKNPKPEDVKESRFSNDDYVIMERWGRLAGILKD